MALEKRSITMCVGKAPESLEAAEKSFVADCKARNLSPQTVTVNGIILRGLCGFLENKAPAEVTSAELRRFFIEKTTSTSPATASRYYDCISRFFKFLADEESIPENPMSSIQKPKAPTPIIEPLSQEQVESMLMACGNKFTGLRNRLVLLILIDSGLWASELCGLTLADVDMENQQFLVRQGKGNKSRRVPFGCAVLGVLRQYLARRAEVSSPNLIINVYGDPVDRYRIRRVVMTCADKAKVNHPHMGPHLLRHSMAVQFLKAGGDVFSLQKMLGHQTLVMTRRYSELADSDVADKHRLCSPADRLRSACQSGSRKRLT